MEKIEDKVEEFIFWTRWLQAPLYLGLTVALASYIYLFGAELYHLLAGLNEIQPDKLIIATLQLIDSIMISNLIFVVIIGGWQTFVSKLDLEHHADKPDWLSYINAGVLKIKLATAIVSITSIELLIDFFQANNLTEKELIWKTIIHCVFLISAVAIAYIEKISHHGK